MRRGTIVSSLLLLALLCAAVAARPVSAQEAPPSRADNGGFVLGEPDAPLTLVLFTDFACPHCQQYRVTFQQFIDAYVVTGQARVEVHILPTAGGILTRFGARIAECADQLRPGGYWAAEDVLYSLALQGRFDTDLGRHVAAELGLPYAKLLSCLPSARQADADDRLAGLLGVNGTPATLVRYGDNPPETIVVDGTPIAGGGAPFAALERLVAQAAAGPEAAATLEAAVTSSRADDGGFVLGAADAPVTVVVFTDFACPHCQTYRDTVLNAFVEDFVTTGRARLELHVFPTAGGEQTVVAARIAECADRLQPGGFWAAHDVLYDLAARGEYRGNLAQIVADRLGLSQPALVDCAATARHVDDSQALAARLGVRGTPAVLVRYGNDEPAYIVLDGETYNRGGVAYDVLARVVDEAS